MLLCSVLSTRPGAEQNDLPSSNRDMTGELQGCVLNGKILVGRFTTAARVLCCGDKHASSVPYKQPGAVYITLYDAVE